MVMTTENGDDRKALFSLMRMRAELQRKLNDKAAWIQVIQEEHARETEPMRQELSHLEEQIKATGVRLIPPDQKFVDVPGYGRVQYRNYKAAIRISDPEAFIAWAKEVERTDLYEVVTTEKLNRAAATKVAGAVLTDDGEQLPGVEVQLARREAYIEDRGVE